MTVENFDEDFAFPHVSEALLARERLIFNTTEDLLLAMQDSGMSRADIAKKMGRSKSFITQVLDGTRNLTLKTLSDITFALGAEVRLTITRNGRDVSHAIVPERQCYETKSSNVEAPRKETIKIVIATKHMDYVQNVA
ncbi:MULTISPECIES: helix-turn-helix transcriptional regulator [unclassified Pantoea]|uniref:helix-turn-helix domain-containing protein n=1 Tax=unclassified Pantoea TaxID=2630326 RepID=UPI002269B983|nr:MULTISPECIES: helix-turn-helix transcriptional regulator [unclassified Pantoea]